MKYIQEYQVVEESDATDLLNKILSSTEGFKVHNYVTFQQAAIKEDAIISRLTQIADIALKQYFMRDIISEFVPKHTLHGVNMLELKAGESVELHTDSEISDGIRTNFVLLLYLNNVSGGELVFPVQGKIIIPKAGKVAIFPTFFTYPHMVLPPTESRYAARFIYSVGTQ